MVILQDVFNDKKRIYKLFVDARKPNTHLSAEIALGVGRLDSLVCACGKLASEGTASNQCRARAEADIVDLIFRLRAIQLRDLSWNTCEEVV